MIGNDTILVTDNSLKIKPVQTWTFRIPLVPVPKGRPRFSRRSGRTYTPPKTKEATIETADIIEKEWADNDVLDCPVLVDATFYMPRPKSVSKKHRLYPTTTPDVDNLMKLLLDAMNGVVFVDDNRVIECAMRKVYADEGEPRTEITIAAIDH